MKHCGVWLLALLLGSSPAFAQSGRPSSSDATLPPPPAPPPALSSPQSSPTTASEERIAPAAPAAPLPTPVVRSGWDDPERKWYGWQLLINDFVALGTLAGAAAAGARGNAALAVIVPAGLVYDLGSPTIHWLHGRKAIAGASLGLRAGVPFAGALLGLVLAGCVGDRSSSANTCRSQGGGYGALAGFAAATAIDASLFAFDAPPSEKLGAGGVSWGPLLMPQDGGVTLGAVGVF